MPNRVTIRIPKSLWTARDSARLAADTLASIKLRTSKGLDADGVPFADYSENALYVSKRGARLSPKGGRPSRTGRSVYYERGYKQYKAQSRRRSKSSSAEVDLVLSGNLMNNLVVKSASADGFVIGITQHAQYGYAVNERREFLGLSSKDIKILTKAVEIELNKRLFGGGRR